MTASQHNEARIPARFDGIGILLALNALYIGFGAILGTVQGGLPPILRQQGHDVATVGWVYAFYLPFGFAFLWAHYIDRKRLPFLGRRTGWIVTMQAIAIAAIGLIAVGASWPLVALAVLGISVTLAMATMDTALDALAVERIKPQQRPLASALKLAALSLGAMIGNGAFVVFFHRFGWIATFLSLAGLMVLLVLPILTIRENGAVAEAAPTEKASLLKVLSNPDRRRRMFLVTLVSCVIFPLAGLNRVMLVDLGVPLERIGWVVGTLGPISMLLVSFASMGLMARLGLSVTFLIFGTVGTLSVGTLLIATMMQDASLAIAGSILVGAAVSGIYVTLMAKIIGWAAGAQPATDYAAYYGISRLASTILTIVAAQAAARMEWSTFYGLGVAILIAVLLFSNHKIFRSET
jgi:MFS transporter, PAT family, beta-lactamase induction signal transducer AmpG